jgi:hypothetical protein
MFRIGEAFGVEPGLAAFYQTRTLAACAAAIDAACSQTAPSAIGRRTGKRIVRSHRERLDSDRKADRG